MWDSVKENGLPAMDFLFSKVDSSILLRDEERGCSLLDFCLEECLKGSQTTEKKRQVLTCATIKRILIISRDNSVSLPSKLLHPILDVVYRYWDISTDVVCYDCIDIFEMLLGNHTESCPDCKTRAMCSFSDAVVSKLFTWPARCRALYKCIHICLRYFAKIDYVDDLFISSIYDAMENPSLSVVVSDIVSQLLSTSSDNWSVHVEKIICCLQSSSNNMRCAIKDRLLPSLLKNPLLKQDFLEMLMDSLKARTLTDRSLDATLSVAKFLIFSQKKSQTYKLWSDCVSRDVIVKAIVHRNSQVRLAAWLLVAEHPKKTQPFSSDDLLLLKMFFLTNMAEQQPATRQKILSGLKKILIRLCETGQLLVKGKHDENTLLDEYVEFIRYICDLSFDSLSMEANFSRRIMALSTIDFIFRRDFLRSNDKLAFHKYLQLESLLTTDRFTQLVSCLDDSYQLCQTLALDILAHVPFSDTFNFTEFRDDTISKMQSIRSHDTLSSGYRFRLYVSRFPGEVRDLLTKFVEMCFSNIKQAEQNLMLITQFTVHPILNTIALLLEKSDYRSSLSADDFSWWNVFVNSRLIPLCFAVSNVVTPVVHSMSPEGYIPEEQLSKMADSSQIHADVSQLLLACCWRAHKHVSCILAWTVTELCPLGIVPATEVAVIGEYFWLQLTECKHCGAFESAVDGFAALCAFLWRTPDKSLPSPTGWLDQIMDALNGKKDLKNLCSTRRSAGLPHLFSTILATEPVPSGTSNIQRVMLCLLEMENKTLEYRVHSLNILKALFSCSAISDKNFALEWACRVAVSGCSASSWSERNSSAQLAAALRSLIFGVTRTSQRDLTVDMKNRLSAFEFFSRFPSLYEYLYQQLSASKDEFSVYPVLIFLTHLFPSSSPQYSLAPFVPACLKILMQCRSEKLRKLAAAAAIAISQNENIDFIMSWLNRQNYERLQQNQVHAALMLVSNVLSSNCPTSQREDCLRFLHLALTNVSQWCDYNINILLELCNQENVNFDLDMPTDDLHLSKRQLARACLSRKDFRLPGDWASRKEYYRWIHTLELGENRLAVTEGSIEIAVEDLSNCPAERDLSFVIAFLHRIAETLSAEWREQIIRIIKCQRDSWRMAETIAVGHQLLFSISEWSGDRDEVEWIETMLDDEDDSAKLLAFRTGCSLYHKLGDSDLLRVLASYLQDEDREVREEASTLLTPFVSSRFESLNPEVCHRLIMSSLPKRSEISSTTVQEEDRNGLYDVCASNSYAEGKTFGDFEAFEHLLSV